MSIESLVVCNQRHNGDTALSEKDAVRWLERFYVGRLGRDWVDHSFGLGFRCLKALERSEFVEVVRDEWELCHFCFDVLGVSGFLEQSILVVEDFLFGRERAVNCCRTRTDGTKAIWYLYNYLSSWWKLSVDPTLPLRRTKNTILSIYILIKVLIKRISRSNWPTMRLNREISFKGFTLVWIYGNLTLVFLLLNHNELLSFPNSITGWFMRYNDRNRIVCANCHLLWLNSEFIGIVW